MEELLKQIVVFTLFILALLLITTIATGCAPNKYMMKNCQDSALKTKKGEPVQACESQWEYWNYR